MSRQRRSRQRRCFRGRSWCVRPCAWRDECRGGGSGSRAIRAEASWSYASSSSRRGECRSPLELTRLLRR